VVIEDSQYGVQAARAAGMTALAYSGGLTDAASLEGERTTVFDDMRQLPELCAHAISVGGEPGEELIDVGFPDRLGRGRQDVVPDRSEAAK
jgi:hypothetical protein